MLGCSGSYPGPDSGACSGYLLRSGDTTVWLDCGNGTLANLQRHAVLSGSRRHDQGETPWPPGDDVTALVITHWHPDHCADIYGLHVLLKYGLGRTGFPVYAPEGTDDRLATLVDGDWGGAFAWAAVADNDTVTVGDAGLRFSRTSHPPPTLAVEVTAGVLAGPAEIIGRIEKVRRMFGAILDPLPAYALGRGLESTDSPVVRQIAKGTEAQGGRWSSLILEIVKSTPFCMRRSDS